MNVTYFRRGMSIYSCKMHRVPCVGECVMFSNDMVDRINRGLRENERLSKTDVYKVVEVMTAHDIGHSDHCVTHEVELEFLR